jgi:hypothetical protein
MRRLALAVLPLLLSAAEADTVYRWVDAEGRVSYSSTPPSAAADVRQVDLPPPPSAAEIDAAKEREKTLGQLADQLEQSRRARDAAANSARQADAGDGGPMQAVAPPPATDEYWGWPAARPWPRPPHWRPHPPDDWPPGSYPGYRPAPVPRPLPSAPPPGTGWRR